MGIKEKLKNLELPTYRPKPKARDVAVVLTQMSVMLRNGLDVASVLDGVAEQQPNEYFREALEDIRHKVLHQGASISRAMRAHQDIFPTTVVLLVRAGEESGDITTCLEEGGRLMERSDELKREMKSALSSPVMTACFGLIMLLLIVKGVFPKFLGLYDQLELELPAITRAVLAVVAFINHPAFIVTILLTAWLLYYYRESIKQRGFKILVQLPVIRYMVGTILCTQMCKVVAVLYSAGIPLHRTINLLASSTPFQHHEGRLTEVGKRLRITGSFSEAVGAVDYYPPLLHAMCAVGEESGSMDLMMESVQQVLDEQVHHVLEQVVSILEPVFICMLGVVMTFFFVGMFLPIYEMLTQLGP